MFKSRELSSHTEKGVLLMGIKEVLLIGNKADLLIGNKRIPLMGTQKRLLRDIEWILLMEPISRV